MSFFNNCFTIRWIMISILIAENFMKIFGIFHKLYGKQFCSQIKKMKKSQLFVLLNIILVQDFVRCLYFYKVSIFTCSWCSESFIKISRVNFENELFAQPNDFTKKFFSHILEIKIFFFRQLYLWLAKKQCNEFELIYCFFTCTALLNRFLKIFRSMVIIKWALNNNRN